MGARWDLLLGCSEVWDETLDAKIKVTKVDATVEHEGCGEEAFGVEDFKFSSCEVE